MHLEYCRSYLIVSAKHSMCLALPFQWLWLNLSCALYFDHWGNVIGVWYICIHRILRHWLQSSLEVYEIIFASAFFLAHWLSPWNQKKFIKVVKYCLSFSSTLFSGSVHKDHHRLWICPALCISVSVFFMFYLTDWDFESNK